MSNRFSKSILACLAIALAFSFSGCGKQNAAKISSTKDASSSSNYGSTAGYGNSSAAAASSGSIGTEKGSEYCAAGIVTGKGVVQEYSQGNISLLDITETASSYRTDNGMTPKQALNAVYSAYRVRVTGTVHIHTKGALLYNMNASQRYYKVIYYPEGADSWAAGKNVACYEVFESEDDKFTDINSSARLIDARGEIIGTAN